MPLRQRRSQTPSNRRRGPNHRAAFFALPNGLTIANLFCGIFAIVLATRKEFALAGTYIVLGGIAGCIGRSGSTRYGKLWDATEGPSWIRS